MWTIHEHLLFNNAESQKESLGEWTETKLSSWIIEKDTKNSVRFKCV